jgi:hypothetical protein
MLSKSTEHNLDLAFTSLDAQREACEAYIRSQAGEGWRLVPDHYDDGGLSGASLDRAALQALLAEVRARRIDVVVGYKVHRLTRSLADFAKLIEIFDGHFRGRSEHLGETGHCDAVVVLLDLLPLARPHCAAADASSTISNAV